MCGRINLRMSPAELAQVFELFREPEWSPRYNLGPMQQALAVRRMPEGYRLAVPMQWGLVPGWAKDPKIGSQMFNARAETVATKPAFRSAFRRRRCLVPASGFYEWQKLEGSKTRQPWNITRADGQPLALAGLWEHWTAPDGSVLESCCVITTTANAFMAEIHDRMPVILGKPAWPLWLDDDVDADALSELLVPCPDDWLRRTAVSTLVNNIRNESPDCVRPLE